MAEISALPSATDWPLYWFAALEKAVEQGNYEAAALAVRELRRLGVDVVYRPVRRETVQRKAVHHAT